MSKLAPQIYRLRYTTFGTCVRAASSIGGHSVSTWARRSPFLSRRKTVLRWLFSFAGDELPRFTQVYLKRVIVNLIQLDPDPPARPDVRRFEVGGGCVFDQQRLEPFRHRHPHG